MSYNGRLSGLPQGVRDPKVKGNLSAVIGGRYREIPCLRCAPYPAIFTRSPIPSACYNCYQTSVCGAGSASREQWKVQVRYDHICNLPHISHIICSCCSRLTCSEFLIVANGAICFSYMPELIYDRELGCQAICRKTKRIPG